MRCQWWVHAVHADFNLYILFLFVFLLLFHVSHHRSHAHTPSEIVVGILMLLRVQLQWSCTCRARVWVCVCIVVENRNEISFFPRIQFQKFIYSKRIIEYIHPNSQPTIFTLKTETKILVVLFVFNLYYYCFVELWKRWVAFNLAVFFFFVVVAFIHLHFTRLTQFAKQKSHRSMHFYTSAKNETWKYLITNSHWMQFHW